MTSSKTRPSNMKSSHLGQNDAFDLCEILDGSHLGRIVAVTSCCDGEGGAAWETFRILLGANQKSDCTVNGNDRKTGLVV